MKRYAAIVFIFGFFLFSFFTFGAAINHVFAQTCDPKAPKCAAGSACISDYSDTTKCSNPGTLTMQCPSVCKKQVGAGKTCYILAEKGSSPQGNCTPPYICKLNCTKSPCTSTCEKAAIAEGQKCTGTGQGDCADGFVCQTTCKKKVVSKDQICGVGIADCTPPYVCKIDYSKSSGSDKTIIVFQSTCQIQTSTCSAKSKDDKQGTCKSGFYCIYIGGNGTVDQTTGAITNGECQNSYAAFDKPTNNDPTLPPPPSPPCKAWNNGQCDTFGSGVGDLATKPTDFIRTLFALLLSFSGAIAVLIIMRSGYSIMTSQGKPEKLKEGQEQLSAAIVGLTFLIFSFVILQVIGYDILRIPGFGG